MKIQKNTRYFLTLLISLVILFLSIFSILYQKIYIERINRITSFELLGQDIVTAIISVLFIYIIVFKDYTKIKIKIIWLGFLMYLFYIYAYFSFGGILSIFYLLYIAITGMSLYLFFMILIDILKQNQFPNVLKNYPRKSISIFLLICVLIVAIIEIIELISKTIINIEKLNPFYVFYILDLSIIFPLISITSILNYKKKVLGYLFSGIALIKIITILPAVIFNDIFHRIYKGYFLDLSFDIIATIITLAGSVMMILYMKTIKENDVSGTSPNETVEFYKTQSY